MEDPNLVYLYQDALAGRLSRRQVFHKAIALGLSSSVIAGLLAACSTGTQTTNTPSPTGSPGPDDGFPQGGASPTPVPKRAGGGLLRLLFWQVPTILNPHLAQGPKDFNAASIVLEPLADFAPDGRLVPKLAAEIPALGKGVAPDGKSVTWKLLPAVTWSDGQPFTAKDVKFTFDYVSNEATAATTIQYFKGVESVQVVDDHTVTVTFKEPSPGWLTVFTGVNGMILPEHLLKDAIGEKARTDLFNLKPVGTGPYKVDDFKPGDSVRYSINTQYRDPLRPSFDQIELTGAEDALSAARRVLQTGEADFAWNLQVDPKQLEQLAEGGKGVIEVPPFSAVQKIQINLSDPRKDVNGEMSSLAAPHPWQSDLNVRRAYALAIQRDAIAKQFYGPTGAATSNILVAPANFVSKNTSWDYNLEQAASLLDTAGWKVGADGVRQKEGVRMALVFHAPVNPLWQQQQELIKTDFEKLGIKVEIKPIDAQVFFDPTSSSPDTYTHFYSDLQMFTNGPTTPYPLDYMESWYGAEQNIPQKGNQWSGRNVERWKNDEYDRLYQLAQKELDPAKQALLFIQMNDLVVNNVVEIPIVAQGTPAGRARNLLNVHLSPWTSDFWNIADWMRTS